MKTNTHVGILLSVLVLLSGRGVAGQDAKVSILKRVDENHARMIQAFVDQDAEAFASCWMPDAVCAIGELPLLRGKDQLSAVFMDAVGGSSMHGLERLNRRIWLSGDFAYETGVYVHSYALAGREQVQSSAKSFVTVWQKQSDGSWKRAAEAWNDRPYPSADQLTDWRAQELRNTPCTVVDVPGSGTDGDMSAITKQLSETEQTFHHCFLTDDVEPALAMYTADARLLSGEPEWFVGQDQIRKRILDSRSQSTMVDLVCDVIATGGDDQMAYAANRFLWKLKFPSTGDQVHAFHGKGLHIWQRQPDGQWKILIDINNMNPPPAERL